MRFKTLFRVILCFWMIQGYHPTEAWRPFEVVLTYLNISTNEQVGIANYTIHNNSAGHSVISGMFQTFKTILNVQMTFTAKHARSDAARPYTVNNTINLCDLFKLKKNLPPIVKVVFFELFSRADLPQKCPIAAGTYHLYNAGAAMEELLPPYIPLATYKLTLRFFSQTQKSFTHFAWGNLTAKLIPNKVKWSRKGN